MKPETLDSIIILTLFGMLAAVLGALAFVPIPRDNMELFTALASGVVGAGVGVVIGNRWGSSRGSDAKNDIMADQAKALAGQADPKG